MLNQFKLKLYGKLNSVRNIGSTFPNKYEGPKNKFKENIKLDI